MRAPWAVLPVLPGAASPPPAACLRDSMRHSPAARRSSVPSHGSGASFGPWQETRRASAGNPRVRKTLPELLFRVPGGVAEQSPRSVAEVVLSSGKRNGKERGHRPLEGRDFSQSRVTRRVLAGSPRSSSNQLTRKASGRSGWESSGATRAASKGSAGLEPGLIGKRTAPRRRHELGVGLEGKTARGTQASGPRTSFHSRRGHFRQQPAQPKDRFHASHPAGKLQGRQASRKFSER